MSRVNTAFGSFVMEGNSFGFVGQNKNSSIQIGFENQFNTLNKTLKVKVEKDVDFIVRNTLKIANTFITKTPKDTNYNLEDVYYYKHESKFPLEAYKKSLELIHLSIDYSQNLEIKNLSCVFKTKEKFAFGVNHVIENFITNNEHFLPKENFINFLDFGSYFSFHPEACINVLKSSNEPNFSKYIIETLVFMEGFVHQDRLYEQTAKITEALILCVETCHKKVQEPLVEVLCYIKQCSENPIKGDKIYANKLKTLFKKQSLKINAWSKDKHLKPHVEFLIN